MRISGRRTLLRASSPFGAFSVTVLAMASSLFASFGFVSFSAAAASAQLLAGEEDRVPVDEVVAVINNEPITRRDIDRTIDSLVELAEKRNAMEIDENDPAVRRQIFPDAVLRAIYDKLLQQMAVKEDFVVEQKVEQRIRLEREKAGSEAAFQRMLAEQEMTLSELEDSFATDERTNTFVSTYFGFGDADPTKRPSVDMNVSPGEIVAYYRENRAEFQIRAAVKLRQIYVSNKRHGGRDGATDVIQDVLERVKAGEDFRKLAEEFDDLASREAGDLGWITPEKEGDYPSAVIEFAKRADVGQVSPPELTQFGIYVTWIEDRRESESLAFRDVQERIRQQLLMQKYNRYEDLMLAKLFDRAVIHPAQLAESIRLRAERMRSSGG